VHGAVRQAIDHVAEVLEIELNSAVDNPLVFPATATRTSRGPEQAVSGAPRTPAASAHQSYDDVILSGGNFHGEPLACALDYLGIALASLAGISERRIERLVNPSLNEGLPPFLAPDAGLNSGFMMAQVTAAALVSENKVLAHPASVDSITTSGNKEDYVSMGMAAALKLKRIVANTRAVLAIEALAAAQALDLLKPLTTSRRGQAAHAAIRAVSPMLERDRSLASDFDRIGDLITSGKIAEALR